MKQQKQHPDRYDPDKVKALISHLGELCDPIALASWIVDRSKRGKKRGPEAWSYTRDFFADYGQPESAEQVASYFETVGVRDEVDASVWIAEHETLIP